MVNFPFLLKKKTSWHWIYYGPHDLRNRIHSSTVRRTDWTVTFHYLPIFRKLQFSSFPENVFPNIFNLCYPEKFQPMFSRNILIGTKSNQEFKQLQKVKKMKFVSYSRGSFSKKQVSVIYEKIDMPSRKGEKKGG